MRRASFMRFRHLLVALILGGLPPGASWAGSPEVDFAKGVVAFSRKDLSQAERHFREVLASQPRNPRAIYYLGQVLFLAGRTAEAVENFRQAIAIAPDMVGARLDLAQALIKAGDFSSAEKELRVAEPAAPERAAVKYYLGYCLYQSGKYKESIEYMSLARDLDQGFGASAAYYLGLAQARTGLLEEARKSFEVAALATENQSLSDMARRNINVLTGERPRVRRFGLYATAGGGYDSNVALEPDQGSGTGSARLFLAAGGYLNILQDAARSLTASLSVSRSFYLAESVSGFDLTDFSGFLGYRHQFGKFRLELAYQGSLDLLSDIGLGNPNRNVGDGVGVYLHSHAGRASVRIAEGESAGTSLEYVFSARFFDYEMRNCFEHSVAVVQDLRLASRLALLVRAGAVIADAYGDNWDMWSPNLEAEARYAPASWLSLNLQAGFRRESYYHFPVDPERLDIRFGAGAGATFWLGQNLSFQVGYMFFINDSNQPFSYQRNIASISVTGQM